ncbi:hypothetical protein [Pedobacter miscanthi]|uniref:hypothetical protein n=1 Tax=Pedobacter miscanthi TaxID=2259170 RepID=UPI00293176ED|nr:hypothetical protein [Pedobacter miscanthi]
MIPNKTILAFTILICVFFNVNAQNDPITKQDLPKGRIRLLVEAGFYIKTIEKKQQAVLRSKIVRTYNVDGKTTQEVIYRDNGSVFDKVNMTYDREGNKTGIKNLAGTIDGTSKVTGQKNGIKTVRTVFKSGNIVLNKYNIKDQKVEDLVYDSSKGNASKTTYVYDKNGHETERNVFSKKDMKLVARLNFYYDAKDRLIRIESRNNLGKILSTKAFKYNSNGLKVSMITTNVNPNLVMAEEYKYERMDTKGNWLKSAVIKNGTVIEVREREIQYY